MAETSFAGNREPQPLAGVVQTHIEIPPEATILLGHPRGPYSHLYSTETLIDQEYYLISLGYSRPVARISVHKLHDLHREDSNLYEEDRVHGYEARRQDLWEGRKLRNRAVAVTIFDFDLLREHVAARVEPFEAVSRRAAVELMLKLTGQPPLDY